MTVTLTGTSPTALEVRGASRVIGTRALLQDVDLEVPRGAIVVLAGANGAGKSSLLRAIGGRLRIDRGAIAIDGLDAAAARRSGRLGVVPQDIALDPHLTVRDNLRLWAQLAGTPRREVEARVDEGLRWAHLADRAQAPVETLSGGMRRGVSLLAGLLHRPAVLLLDEPTAGLDADARQRVYDLVGDLRRRHVTLVLATHELDEIAGLCDVVAVMRGGRLVAQDRPEALVTRHAAGVGEWVIDLAGQVPAASVSALEREGFVPAGGTAWTRPDRGAAADPRVLHDRLTAQGLAVREVRWRRPTLQTVVAAITARAAGDPS